MHKIKFKCFGDAYYTHRELFYLGNSQDYVSYYDLLSIMNKQQIPYEVLLCGPNELVKKETYIGPKNNPQEYTKNIGWTSSEGIELVEDENNNETIDIWYLILPDWKKLKED